MIRTPQPQRRGCFGGNLDVPLSVFPTADDNACLDVLVSVYTEPGGLVLDATGALLTAAADTDRALVALVPDGIAASLEPARCGQVRQVDIEFVPDAVAAFVSEAHLIIAPNAVTDLPGWWTACRSALVAGGHVAVVSATADPSLHTDLTTAATEAGFGFAQHLVVVSTGALDDALAEATVGDARARAQVHRRAHRDVFVFTSPGPITPVGVGW